MVKWRFVIHSLLTRAFAPEHTAPKHNSNLPPGVFLYLYGAVYCANSIFIQKLFIPKNGHMAIKDTCRSFYNLFGTHFLSSSRLGAAHKRRRIPVGRSQTVRDEFSWRPVNVHWCFCYNHRKPCSSSCFGVTGFHFAIVLVVEYPARQKNKESNRARMNKRAKGTVLTLCRRVPDSDRSLEGSGGGTSGNVSPRPSASLSPDDAGSSAFVYAAGFLWYLAR